MAAKPENVLTAYGTPIAIAALVVLLIFLGFMTYRFVASNSDPGAGTGPPPAQAAKDQTTRDWIEEKAKESHGQITNLSAADQAKLQQLSGGQGQRALGYMYAIANHSSPGNAGG